MRARNFAWWLSLVLAACGGGGGVDSGGIDAPAGSCTGAADGTSCGTAQICVGGACVTSECGDNYVDTSRGEECDDGNTVAFDGCEPGTCELTCTDSTECDDMIACNGAEQCTAVHACESGTALPDGSDCVLAGGGDGTCRLGDCVVPGCGDGVVSGDEHCDDGNDTARDGCEPDCRFTCEIDTSRTNTWYLDCDGDGYAATGAPMQMGCLMPAPMVGSPGTELEFAL